MKLRYVIGALIALVMLVLATVMGGASITWFINIPALIIVVIPTLSLSLTTYRLGEIGETFRLAFGKKKRATGETAATPSADPEKIRHLERAITVVRGFGRYAYYSAGLGTVIGFISILGSLGEIESPKIGFNVAIALITLLYATVLNYLLFEPMKANLKKGITETRA